jgi:hypothetical protein
MRDGYIKKEGIEVSKNARKKEFYPYLNIERNLIKFEINMEMHIL